MLIKMKLQEILLTSTEALRRSASPGACQQSFLWPGVVVFPLHFLCTCVTQLFFLTMCLLLLAHMESEVRSTCGHTTPNSSQCVKVFLLYIMPRIQRNSFPYCLLSSYILTKL